LWADELVVARRGAIGVFFDITRLERLERVRQEFLSNVSHELRTPLTAIIAFVETLEGGAMGDPENSRRFISIIGRNAARMRSLINDILELSAIEAGTVFIEARPVRLWQMVNDVTTSLASRAEARGVTLVNEVPPDTVVFADPRRLEQMLTNLVDNAVKFNREGGEVSIRHERETRDRISVTDAGDGIPPEHIKRIFERFYRVDRARSREMGGTGLGLAIVKHLARAHGGEASVHSTPGVGSTFTVELPPAPASCEPAASATGQSAAEPDTHSLPRAFLRRVVQLERLRQSESFRRRQVLVEGAGVVRVQVVLHRRDLFG
jgi:two-component system, OmpR family, phosphate regulon sensor histidine kinase PhoR